MVAESTYFRTFRFKERNAVKKYYNVCSYPPSSIAVTEHQSCWEHSIMYHEKTAHFGLQIILVTFGRHLRLDWTLD